MPFWFYAPELADTDVVTVPVFAAAFLDTAAAAVVVVAEAAIVVPIFAVDAAACPRWESLSSLMALARCCQSNLALGADY